MSALTEKKGFVENWAYVPKKSKKHRNGRYISLIVAIVFLCVIVLGVLYSSATNSNLEEENLRAEATHVVINEVYYDVPNSYSEPQCEWIEIYNPTSSEVDISGWMISDDPAHSGSNEGVWTFSDGTVIPADGYILVVNDATYKEQFNSLFPNVKPNFDTNSSNDIPDVSTAGSLSLANSGDDVHLFDSSGNEVDVMWYGNGGDMGSTNAAPLVESGHSLARYFNAQDTGNPSEDFYDEKAPTPGAQNTLSIPELRSAIVLFIAISIFYVLRCRRYEE